MHSFDRTFPRKSTALDSIQNLIYWSSSSLIETSDFVTPCLHFSISSGAHFRPIFFLNVLTFAPEDKNLTKTPISPLLLPYPFSSVYS